MRRIPLMLATVVAAVIGAGGSPAVAAVTPAPAWRLVSSSAPSTFSTADVGERDCQVLGECDQFQIRLVNVGAAATDGSPITVTDTVPEGLTVTRVAQNSEPAASTAWQCEGTGSRQVSCTHSAVVPALEQLPPISVWVRVGAVLPDSLLSNHVAVEGGGAVAAAASSQVLVEPTTATPYGFAAFENYVADSAGAQDLQAGDHPASLTTTFDINSVMKPRGLESPTPEGPERAVQFVKDVVVDLPVGFLGDPQALPRCPQGLLAGRTGSGCPADTQVGVITWKGLGGYAAGGPPGATESAPIYNLVPTADDPADFGFEYVSQRVLLHASVRTGSDYGLRVAIPGLPTLVHFDSAEVTFFGNPLAHDVGGEGAAFFTNPSDCSGGPLKTVIHTDSWENPAKVSLNPDGSLDLNAADFSEPQWKTAVSEAPALDPASCAALSFAPSFSFQPENTEAATPSGYSVDLHIPQEHFTEPGVPATPDLKKTVVRLPEGLVVNPASAAGLAACSEEQIGLSSTFSATCPAASKLGTVEVDTPLLEETPGEHPLMGSVYLARQSENPFHSLLAIYVVVEGDGVVVKLPGEVAADPATGRLTVTFDNTPQLPFEDFKLRFFGGSRAALTNPQTCGQKLTETELTPWSAPQSGPPALSGSPFNINSGPGGSACVTSVSEQPNTPGFLAGTENPLAGSFSTFFGDVTRAEGTQTLSQIVGTLPPGLIGKIAGVTECSEAQIAQAEARDNLGEGAVEVASPSCPSSSLIATATVGVGAGPNPFYVTAKAYFAGPYKGAPFSGVFITPAIAGPYDLGVVVTRGALYIDPATAQVTLKADPLPTIVHGIPVDIRSIDLNVNRPEFVLNPTSCNPMTIAATITGSQGATANVASPFAATGCAGLPFKPSFTASTSAKTSKANGASLVVNVSQKPGEANIHKVALTLPLVLPARLTTLQKACTEAQFNANPAGCPEASFIGTATANSPVLPVPLTGPAILVSHGGAAFPDVEFILQGDGVEIVLDGKTDIKKGITYSRFETVPDAPISSFVTTLPEGPHSVLAANGNLCATTKTVTVKKRVTVRSHGHTKHLTKTIKKTIATPLTMPTTITGQNGGQITQMTHIAVTGCSKVAVKKKAKAHGKKGKKGKK